MSPVTLLLLGIELSGPTESGAVSASAPALQLFASQATALPVYRGPLLRPELAVQRGSLWLGLAPAVHTSRDGDVRVLQGTLSVRPRYQGEVLLLGVDLGASAGRARRNGETVATSGLAGSIAPTVGGRAAVGDNLYLTGRALWTMVALSSTWEQSLSGAVSASWRW